MTDWSKFTADTSTSNSQPVDWSKFEFTPVEEAKPKRTLVGTGKDVAVTAGKGLIGLAESGVGLADLVSGGKAGKALEDAGYNLKADQEFLSNQYSDAQKAANAKVENAQGFMDTAKAAIQNPSTIATAIGESLPSMVAGGLVGRGVGAVAKLGEKAVPYLGGLGEGVVSAGQGAEQIRQQTDDGLLTGKQAAIAAGSGALTGLIGAGSNKLASKLGVTDADTLLAGGTQGATNKGLVRRIGEGALMEGALEELPQSTQEQMAQNVALNKDPMQGVGNAAAMGLLTGGFMGGGMGVLHKNAPVPVVTPPPELAAQPQPNAPQPNAPTAYPKDVYQDELASVSPKPNFTMSVNDRMQVVPYGTQGQRPAPAIKPNSPLNNALASAGISTAPQLAQLPALAENQFTDSGNTTQPPLLNSPLQRAPTIGSNAPRNKIYNPEKVQREAAEKAKLTEIFNSKKPPAPLDDERVAEYGETMRNMVKDLQIGGGVTIMPDGSRTPSTNMQLEWFNGLRDIYPNANLTPKGVETAVNKAIEGKKLHKNQEAIVVALLDHIDEQQGISRDMPQQADDAFSPPNMTPDARTPDDDLRDALERVKPHFNEDDFYELATDESLPIEKRTQFLNSLADNYEKENDTRNEAQKPYTEPSRAERTEPTELSQSQNDIASEATRGNDVNFQSAHEPVANAYNNSVEVNSDNQQVLNEKDKTEPTLFDNTLDNGNDAKSSIPSAAEEQRPPLQQSQIDKLDHVAQYQPDEVKNAIELFKSNPNNKEVENNLRDVADSIYDNYPAAADLIHEALDERNTTEPILNSIRTQETESNTGKETNNGIETRFTEAKDANGATFFPTHQLPDGTKVKLETDDEGNKYFIEHDGSEWDYTDNAEELTNEKNSNIKSTTGIRASNSSTELENYSSENKDTKRVSPTSMLIQNKQATHDLGKMRDSIGNDETAKSNIKNQTDIDNENSHEIIKNSHANKQGESETSEKISIQENTPSSQPILKTDGTPVTSFIGARGALKKQGLFDSHEVVKQDDGSFVAMPKNDTSVSHEQKLGEKFTTQIRGNTYTVADDAADEGVHTVRTKDGAIMATFKVKNGKVTGVKPTYKDGANKTEALKAVKNYEQHLAGNDTNVNKRSDFEQKAHEAATSPHNDLPEPTQAQKESGNYKKGHTKFQGLDITIENPKGSKRSGTDKDGKAWSVDMAHHYGYVKGSVGADNEQVDVFVGDNHESTKAFVVNQIHPHNGKFDEHKVMLGFNTEAEAREGYLKNYAKGWKGLDSITEIPVSELKAKIESGAIKKPIKPVEKLPENKQVATDVSKKDEKIDTLEKQHHVGDYYKNASIADIEKQLIKDRKRAEKLSAQSMNQMSFNGNRSTRKATAEHGATQLYNKIHDLENYVEARKKAESTISEPAAEKITKPRTKKERENLVKELRNGIQYNPFGFTHGNANKKFVSFNEAVTQLFDVHNSMSDSSYNSLYQKTKIEAKKLLALQENKELLDKYERQNVRDESIFDEYLSPPVEPPSEGVKALQELAKLAITDDENAEPTAQDTTNIYDRSNRSNFVNTVFDEKKTALVAKAGVTGTQIQNEKQKIDLPTFAENADIKSLGFDEETLKNAEHLINNLADSAIKRKQAMLDEIALAEDLEKMAGDKNSGITIEDKPDGSKKYTMVIDGKPLSFTRYADEEIFDSQARKEIDELRNRLVEIGGGEWGVAKYSLHVQPLDETSVDAMRDKATAKSQSIQSAEDKLKAAAEAHKTIKFFDKVIEKLKSVFYGLFNPKNKNHNDDDKRLYKWRNADNTVMFTMQKGKGTFNLFKDDSKIKGNLTSEKAKNTKLKKQLIDEMEAVKRHAIKRGAIQAKSSGQNKTIEINNAVMDMLSGNPVLQAMFDSKIADGFANNFEGFEAAKEVFFDKTADEKEQKNDSKPSIFNEATAVAKDKQLSHDALSKIAKKFVRKFAHKPTIIIMDSVKELLPNSVVTASGMVMDGRIYLFRDGIIDSSDAEKALWHEMLHYGIRRFMTESQYIDTMFGLYKNDSQITKLANDFRKSEQGQQLLKSGKSHRYVIARGVDEALAEIAEQGLKGNFKNNSFLAKTIRAISKWIANTAKILGFRNAAAKWESVTNNEARKLIAKIFKKLERNAEPASKKSDFTSDATYRTNDNLASDYEKNREMTKSTLRHFKDIAKRFGGEIVHGTGSFLGGARTRLENISPKLGAKYVQLEHNISTHEARLVKTAQPFMTKTKSMTKADAADFDFAMKNAYTAKIDELVDKYQMRDEYNAVQQALEELRQDAFDVGLTDSKLNRLFPRALRDVNGFMDAMGEGVFTKKLREYAVDLGINADDLAGDLKANLINNMIESGYQGTGESLEKVSPELNQFFLNSNAAMLSHIHNTVKHIEYRKFLGKIPTKVAKIRTELGTTQAAIKEQDQLIDNATTDDERESARQKREALISTEKQLDVLLNKYLVQRDYRENIGSYIMKLIADGEIKPHQERIVQEVLNARLHEYGATGVAAAYKNLSLIDTMGSPISAITQLGDFTWAMYESGGLFGGLKAVSNAIRGKAVFDRTDYGLERLAQEFTESDTFAGAVDKVFGLVGIKYTTGVASDSLLNAISDKLTRQAKADDSRLIKKLETYFEGDAQQVLDDLKNGVINDNTRLMIYSRYLDFAPVTLSELPIKYQTAGNGRLFYTLKSYTLKLFDVYRREAVQEIFSGDKQRAIQGMKNLTMILALLMLTGAGADELKDYILGRNTDFDDRMVDNLWRLAGLSKFITWQVRREGVGTAALNQILPPFAFVNALGNDIIHADDIKRHPKNEMWVNGLDVTNSIPVVGKIYYWQIGRGTTKHKELSEIRFTKEKQKLNDIKDEFEQLEGDEKKRFYIEHKADFGRLKQAGHVQASANRIKEIINKQRAMPKSDAREAVISKLEKQRDAVISRFVGMG